MHILLIRTYIILGLLFLTPVLRAADNGHVVPARVQKDLKDAYAIMYTKKGSGLPDVLRREIFSYNKRGYPAERFLTGHTGYVAWMTCDIGADGIVRVTSHSEDGTIRTWNTETGVCENSVNTGGCIEPYAPNLSLIFLGRDGKRRLITRENHNRASGDFRLCIRHLELPADYACMPLNAFEIAFGVGNTRNSQEDPLAMAQLSQQEEDILAGKVHKTWDIFSLGKVALGLGVLGFATYWLWKKL